MSVPAEFTLWARTKLDNIEHKLEVLATIQAKDGEYFDNSVRTRRKLIQVKSYDLASRDTLSMKQMVDIMDFILDTYDYLLLCYATQV
jgi:hypothetical protein